MATARLLALYECRLDSVFTVLENRPATRLETFTYNASSVASPVIKVAKPKVLIPVFPGTNCEFDSAKVMRDAGADVKTIVIRNLNSDMISSSVDEFASELKDAQMIFVPGGFSGGD